MSSVSTTAAPTNTASGSAAQTTRIANAYGASFAIPHGINLPQFDGTHWTNWSGTFEVIPTIHEAEDLIQHATVPTGSDPDEWNNLQRRVKAYLRLYIKPDVYSHVASDTTFPSVKEKWDQLKLMYRSVTGSTCYARTAAYLKRGSGEGRLGL